jgi:hypothetical protein
MSRVTMPVLVRLLACAALYGAVSVSSVPDGQWSQSSANTPNTHLPTTNSFSGYIIAVG